MEDCYYLDGSGEGWQKAIALTFHIWGMEDFERESQVSGKPEIYIDRHIC